MFLGFELGAGNKILKGGFYFTNGRLMNTGPLVQIFTTSLGFSNSKISTNSKPQFFFFFSSLTTEAVHTQRFIVRGLARIALDRSSEHYNVVLEVILQKRCHFFFFYNNV
jgi:hypothetical protein